MSINIEQKLAVDFKLLEGDPTAKASDCLVLGVWESAKPATTVKLSKQSSDFIQKCLKQSNMEGKIGQSVMLYHVPGIKAPVVLLMGCGKPSELNDSHFKNLCVYTTKALTAARVKSAICCLNQIDIKSRDMEWGLRFAVESVSYELYDFHYFKSKAEKPKLAEVYFAIQSKNKRKLELVLEQSCVIAEAVQFARDLGNMPANICTPSYLSKQALSMKSLSKKVHVDIFDREKLQEMGANAILAVAQGSHEPCQLVSMEYRGGKKSAAPIVLVGKGVCFDSGGLCIKGRDGMNLMRMDMCGAATVISVFYAAVKLALPINLVVVAPCVENMPDGKAFRPGDIIKSMSGQTIEVLDTDAEGRLILCDALTYCERFNPDCVIDVATLTGAVMVALGQHLTGLYANHDPLANELLKAGKASNDPAWHMPITEEFQKQIDSKIADMANLGGPYGGSVTAACFLARFTKKYHWAHLDVAGTAMAKEGAKGRPVNLLIEFLLGRLA
ncbi:MAG: leucyl aminopeptidase [Gammaproteobacteria bacterium]|jgi:leucyl aminopeptidase|nr:leucyl aminopeptidase [Gammaproteobacteria bacterium]